MKTNLLLIALMLLINVFTAKTQTATAPANGDGTSVNPYEITTLDNLYWLSQNSAEWDKHYIQTAYINAVDTKNWDTGAGFSPIGNESLNFAGEYNGKGYSIDSLFINRSSDYIGLFGYATDAKIDSVKLLDVDISGQYFKGALIGWIESSTISYSNSSGLIKDYTAINGYSGGLIGVSANSTINYCYSDCLVTGSYSGGLVGELRCSGSSYTSIIMNSYSTGTVTNGSRAGGLVGNAFSSEIINCYSTSNVNGSSFVGGLVGRNTSSISNSYSTGNVNGTHDVGGFVGEISNIIVTNCYSTGLVTGSEANIGGLIGGVVNGATTNNSFWDTQTSGQGTSASGTGKTTIEMQMPCVYIDNAWDFMGETANGTEDIWGMNASENGSYPFLAWQAYSNTEECCPPEGAGTTSDPYKIATLCNLKWLSATDTVWDKHYIQTANINAASTRNWDSKKGFLPIGNEAIKFTGTYNGKGYVIDSLFINRSSDYIGLFGYVTDAAINNVGVTNIDILGINRTGGLIGMNSRSSLNHCYSTGIVSVKGSSQEVGGLVGYNYNSSVISNSYSEVVVEGYQVVGGLVGVNHAATVNNSYSIGKVIGSHKVGGLVGSNRGVSTINYVYSIGAVSGNSNVGGLVGYNDNSTVSNSFWDTETSGQTTSAGGIGKTTAEMKDIATFTSTATTGLDAAWDFLGTENDDAGTNDYWNMVCNSYPYLTWQTLIALPSTVMGTGTQADPYQISTLCELRWLANTDSVWDKHFVQTANINASDTKNWNVVGSDTLGFKPIANSTTKFTGAYNGQSYTIDSLFINRIKLNYIGLFGITYGATINNLGLTNVNIIGHAQVGALAGIVHTSSNINNCYSTGVVSGNFYDIAGLVGHNRYSTISNCYSTADVSNTGTWTNQRTGGLVGVNYSANSIIQNCYSTGNVTGTDNNVGGLLGMNYNGAKVENCYSTGAVSRISGFGGIGGLIASGNSNSICINSFWDTETSGLSWSYGGTGKTTAQMQTLCTYVDGAEASWDFNHETTNGTDDIWGMNASENGAYPFLAWQGYSQTEECNCIVEFTKPVLAVQNYIAQLNEAGTATITALNVVISATDNCTIADTTLSQTSFDCSNIGTPVNVDVSLTDESGNTDIITVAITVVDNINPIITCIANQLRTLTLGQTEYTVVGTELDTTVTNDNCTIANITNNINTLASLNGETFAIGTHAITWTVTDNSGNTNNCSFTVQIDPYVGVNDNVSKDIVLYPNPTTGKFLVSGKSIKKIEVFNIYGKKIQTENANKSQLSIDLSNYSKGTYILKITTNTSIVSKSVVIVNK